MSGSYVPGQGLPFALPLGSPGDATLAQISREFPGVSTPNTPHPLAAESSHRRLSRRALEHLAEVMPERDHRVLELVAAHRFLTTNQIERFVFTEHASADSASRSARYVLARLEKNLLLASLERRIGGVRSGSAARIWQLTAGAARLLKADGLSFRRHEPSPRFLAHCLAVADVHLLLRDLKRGHVSAIDVQVEPESWRSFTGAGGERRSLQPDLSATVHATNFSERWFVEVDLGTESLPTLLRKCAQYESYRSTGIEQDEHGAFPLVWWVLTDADRAARLQHTIRRTPRLTPDLYRVTTFDGLQRALMEALQ